MPTTGRPRWYPSTSTRSSGAKPLHGAGTLFTIHNLAYQGNFESGAMFITGLGQHHFNSSEFEHFGDMNLMKAAIRHANLLSTVSPTYAREIQTSGYGLASTVNLRCAASSYAACSTASTITLESGLGSPHRRALQC